MLSISIIPCDSAVKLDPHQPIVARRKSTMSSHSALDRKTRGADSLSPPDSTSQSKHISFASPLSATFSRPSTQSPLEARLKAENAEKSRRQGRLSVRLAEEDVVVPAVDRGAEVLDLLFSERRNSALCEQLEALYKGRHDVVRSLEAVVGESFNHKMDDLSILKALLTTITREELPDTKWLTAVCQIVMSRSAKLWCSLSDCLGTSYVTPQIIESVCEADEVLLSKEVALQLLRTGQNGKDLDIANLQSSDVHSEIAIPSSSKSSEEAAFTNNKVGFEVLHDIPTDYYKTPIAYLKQRPSWAEGDGDVDTSSSETRAIDIPRLQKHPRSGSVSSASLGTSLSHGTPEDVRDLLETSKNKFAGLSLRLNTTESCPSQHFPSSSGGQRSGSSSSRQMEATGPELKKFRRLSSLILPSIHEQTKLQTESLRGRDFAAHNPRSRRFLSASSSLGSLVLPTYSHTTEPKPRTSTRQSRGASTSEIDGPPLGLLSPSSASTARSGVKARLAPKSSPMEASLIMSSLAKKGSSSGSSSGAGSGTDESVSSTRGKHIRGLLPDGRTRHPSSSSQDGSLLAAREAFRREVQLSPSSPTDVRSSTMSSPETSECGLSPLSVSCGSVKTPMDWQGFQMSPIGLGIKEEDGDSLLEKTSYPSARQFRASQLQFKRDLRSTLQVDSKDDSLAARRAKKNQKSPFGEGEVGLTHSHTTEKDLLKPVSKSTALIFPIPPNKCFSRERELTLRLDEAQMYAKHAWSTLYNALHEDGINLLKATIAEGGERNETCDEELLITLAQKCFELVDFNAASRHGPRKDITAAQTSLDSYMDDIDGYELRWNGFVALLRDIWLVEDCVIHQVRERCGPAQRLDLSSSSSVTASDSVRM